MSKIETKYYAIPNGYFANYFKFLIGRVWKILPMKEEGNKYLKRYMESLQRELIGNMNLVEELKYDGYFITLLNKIEFLINENYDHSICRKEVFECIELVKVIRERHFTNEEITNEEIDNEEITNEGIDNEESVR